VPQHDAAVSGPLVSIVVPVLDDTAQLAGLLGSLARPASVELVVALGAPPDRAMRELQARTAKVTWVESAAGRGAQMNAGARRATGRWLLFLHADARLEPGWLDVLRRVDAEGRAVGGCYRLVLDSTAWAARVIEWGVAWRVRLLNLPYGDQAIFVRRAIFEEVGGYREIPLMEDIDLVRRLRRAGRLWHAELGVRVSARRWESDGWWRRSTENVILAALYVAGVDPASLARIYDRQGAARARRPSLSRDAHDPEP
jgi:rSAM/selenodomain-associated transferase 2